MPDGRVLDFNTRPLVMGVLNVTPDSFSDGGRFLDPDAAVQHAMEMVRDGVDILDVGGESTRPGSDPVPADEELERVVPVIGELARRCEVPVSIDTQKAAVARAALDAGAQIVNDVSALRTDPEMAAVVAEADAPAVLMHMQGTPRTMQESPVYEDVVDDVKAWLADRMETAERSGIGRDKLLVDPGFGFGKRLGHNLEMLRRLAEFHELDAPLLIGTSRKSMIGAILGVPAQDRLHGTLATVACAVMSGAHVVRVHDVRPALEVVKVCEAIRRGMDGTDE
jgi:dihydropteroate synthase